MSGGRQWGVAGLPAWWVTLPGQCVTLHGQCATILMMPDHIFTFCHSNLNANIVDIIVFYTYMGQFPQDGENGLFVSLFF